MENAIRVHGHPKYHVRVGSDRGQAVDDRQVKKVRRQFNPDTVDEKTNWITGEDIEIETLDTESGIDIETITQNDLTLLAAAMGVPEEMVGLGRGSTEATAKVRLQAFERQARAEQRRLADQFIKQVIRPVLAEYSPYDRDVDISLRFGDVVSDQRSTAEWMRDFKDVFTIDEMRGALDFAPYDGDEEELGPPEEASTGETSDLFSGGLRDSDSDRVLADIPERYINDTDLTESDFVPPEGAADAARQALKWKEEHGDEMDAGASDGEGWRRADQIVEAVENDEPMSPDLVEEIAAFHSRHRAQGNHELDEQYRGEPWRDNGYVSDHTWGSDAAAEWAEDLNSRMDEIDEREMTATSHGTEGTLWRDQLGVDDVLGELHKDIIEGPTDRRLFEFSDDEIPEFARERLRDAIDSGAVFSQFDTTDESIVELRQTLKDSLETQHGWGLQSLADNLQDLDPDLGQDEAERIARTETASIVNNAREEGYKERGEDDHLFRWVGPSDSRTTEACEWLEQETEDGVPLNELKDLVEEANRRFVDHPGREWVPHINCRHTYVRDV
jgi:hypothetical protein